MRVNIPTPVVALIITVVVLVVGYVLWQGTNPGRNAEKTEWMLRKAFGGGKVRGAPVPPAGATKPSGVPGITFPDR